MVAKTTRPPRFSPPVRELSPKLLRVVQPQQHRELSPASVRCSVEAPPKRSLSSSLPLLVKPSSEDAWSSSSLHSVSSSLSNSTHHSASSAASRRSPRRKRRSNRRRVTFKPLVAMKRTISRYEMTDAEIEAYWLEDEDYARIRKESKQLIDVASPFHTTGDPLISYESPCYHEFEDHIERTHDGYRLCLRGLEAGSKSRSLRRRSVRQNMLEKILVEQEVQCLSESRDEEALADLYIELTAPCKYRAVHMAMEDRLAVEKYYYNDDV